MTTNDAHSPQGKKPVVAVFPLKAIGHLQMLLPIVKELLDRGTEVHMFLDDLGAGSKAEEAIDSLVHLGLKRYPLVSLVSDDSGDFVEVLMGKYLPLLEAEENASAATASMLKILAFIYMHCDLVPILLKKLESIRPDCIVFDTMSPCGHLAGKIMNIPTIGYVSYAGPGCSSGGNGLEHQLSEQLKNRDVYDLKAKIFKPLLDEYNLDVMEETYNCPGPVFYSDYINIVTTIEEIAQRHSKIHEKRLSTFKYIGPAIDENLRLNATTTPTAKEEVAAAPATEDECISSDPFLDVKGDIPWQMVTDAKCAGKKVICLSFGTVLTSFKWKKLASPNESAEKEGSEKQEQNVRIDLVGGAETGKELCQRVWRNLFEAFGNDPNVLFIVSIGKQEDTLEGEGLQVPPNFIIRHEIPQLKVLEHSDAFITHGGWNSLQESLQYGVPMLVLPANGDQPANARKANEAGIGIGIEEPYLNASVDVLETSLNKLLNEESYKARAIELGKKLTKSNGPKQAADIILSAAF